MKNPACPDRVARHDCLEPLGLSMAGDAKVLGATPAALVVRKPARFARAHQAWLFLRISDCSRGITGAPRISPTILNFPAIKPNRLSPSSAPARCSFA